jgi:hypothetical protein
MRASSLIVLTAFLGLTVSCAHKQAVVDSGDKQEKVVVVQEKKDQKKKDKDLAYTCLVGKDQRVVTLDKREKRCEVNYTKFGDEQQVAWAEATPSICQDAFSNIRTNIEGAGYKCLDGTNVKFHKEKKVEEKKPLETAANTTEKK